MGNKTENIKEYQKEYHKKYYQDNKEKLDARVRDWLKNHPGYGRKYFEDWKKKNPERWKQIWKKSYKKWLSVPKNEFKHRLLDKKYVAKKRKSGLIDKTQEHKEWREKNPLAYKAHHIFHRAKKRGEIEVGTECELKDEFCSKVIQAHHPDYNKPLEVVWLCASHHKKVDLGLIKLK